MSILHKICINLKRCFSVLFLVLFVMFTVQLFIVYYYYFYDAHGYKMEHYHFEQIRRFSVGCVIAVSNKNVENYVKVGESKWRIHNLDERSSCGIHNNQDLHKAVLNQVQKGTTHIYISSETNTQTAQTLSRLVLQPHMWALHQSKNSNPLYDHFIHKKKNMSEAGIILNQSSNRIYELGVWRTSLVQKVLNQMDLYSQNQDIPSQELWEIMDSRAPTLITTNSKATFRKENILFRYDSFWAVYPLSHKAEIWSMWVQRLLQELGSFVSFVSTKQRGKCQKLVNTHSPVFDKLQQWHCDDSGKDFFACVLSLSRFMADEKIISVYDFQEISLWLSDLVNVNYRIPSLQKSKRSLASLEPIHRVIYNPSVAMWPMKTKRSFGDQCTMDLPKCPLGEKIKPITNILLIIVFNTEGHYRILDFLEKIYRPVFKNIIYCGTNLDEFSHAYKTIDPLVSFLEVQDDFTYGQHGYQCMQNAMRMGYDVDGYLHLSDDVLLNLWNINDLPVDKFWFQSSMRIGNISQDSVQDVWRDPSWWPWESRYGKSQVKKVLSTLQKFSHSDSYVSQFLKVLEQNSGSSEGVFYEPSDIFYVPQRLAEDFRYFISIFDSYKVYLEIAIPTILNGLDINSNIVRLTGDYLWYSDRRYFKETYNHTNIFLHPIKFGPCLVDDECVKFLCQKYLPCLTDNS